MTAIDKMVEAAAKDAYERVYPGTFWEDVDSATKSVYRVRHRAALTAAFREAPDNLFHCPKHGLLSEREGQDAYEGHDGTFFGSHPGGDPYTGEFFCGLAGSIEGSCYERLTEVQVVAI